MLARPNTDAINRTSVHNPADNTDAVVTIAAAAGQFWVIDWILWSFDETPAITSLTVVTGSTTILHEEIAALIEPHELLLFPRGLTNNTANEAVVVTLTAGGAGIGGALSVGYH